MKASLSLSNWRGSLTVFSGFFDTRPACEIADASWGETLANIAPPDGPALVTEKERAPYFVPCTLKAAPLVGATLARAIQSGAPTTGKQRSAGHVTEARMLVADVDGVTKERFDSIQQRLQDRGLTYVLYSTHSHGREDKPGIRVRLVIPVGVPLDAQQYKLAAQGMNALLLDGQADPAGLQLHQQQGVWATAPKRAHLAFRLSHKAGVCSAATLLAAAPKLEIPMPRLCVRGGMPAAFDAARVGAALQWLDSNEYKVWVDAALWLKAAYGDAVFPCWLSWSQTAAGEHRASTEECETLWGALMPRIGAEQGVGALFGRARDVALAVAREAVRTRVWGAREKGALVYLKRFHARLYAELFGVTA